jgi:aspartokinase/homoserine dehydrogenase 1
MDTQKSTQARSLVMKFGGTSLNTPQAMGMAAEIVSQAKADWPRLVVVTSALSGVTNLLLDSAVHAARGDLSMAGRGDEQMRNSHSAIAKVLVPDAHRRKDLEVELEQLIGEFLNLCRAMAVLGEATPRALDAVASLGERMSVRLLAAALEAIGVATQYVESTQLIITDDKFQNAHPNMEVTRRCTTQVLDVILARGRVPVVTGFIGATAEGITTTLGRGGSDYSAAILGAALSADDVWIWTDVDGVMTADPRLVPDARSIPQLSYREMAELAYFGAKVLHPRTILPVVEAGIGLRICNTFHPDHPGTRLVAENASDKRITDRHVVKAVTAISKQRLITVEGRGMMGVPGVAARTFGSVASTGTSVPLISQASSEQSICFAVPDESANQVLAALEATFSSELLVHDIDRVWATDEVAIITAVGKGMIRTPGVAGRVFSAMGQRGINIIAIAQGSSEVSVSMVVAARDAEPAVQALHALIVNGKE